MSNEMILIICIPITIFLVFTICFLFDKYLKLKTKKERAVSIKQILDLEKLRSDVEKMYLPKYNHERILDAIDSQIRMIKNTLIEEFGTKVFEEMIEQERNKK